MFVYIRTKATPIFLFVPKWHKLFSIVLISDNKEELRRQKRLGFLALGSIIFLIFIHENLPNLRIYLPKTEIVMISNEAILINQKL